MKYALLLASFLFLQQASAAQSCSEMALLEQAKTIVNSITGPDYQITKVRNMGDWYEDVDHAFVVHTENTGKKVCKDFLVPFERETCEVIFVKQFDEDCSR